MLDKLSVFLIGWMGGPQRYRERFGRIVIPAAHERFAIGPAERDQWLACMQRALDDVQAEDDLAALQMEASYQMADMCRSDEEARSP